MTLGLVPLLVAALSGPALALDPGLYPAAQCASFWHGYADYARLSANLDANADDRARAEAFRAVAHRQGDPQAVDTYIAEQRVQMVRLIDAYIYGKDDQSQDLFVSLSQTCEHFARTQPETRSQP